MSRFSIRPTRGDLLIACLLAAFSVVLVRELFPPSDDGGRGFCKRVYTDEDGNAFYYQVFVPYAYRPDKKWPVILYLHGAGHSGTDGEAMLRGGLATTMVRRLTSFPFLVVFPQSFERTWDAEGDDAQRALAILDEVSTRYAVDPERVYLTGISMGGGGTWSLAHAYPERWAAIVPICGYGDPGWAEEFAHLPCWCFHGAADEVISVEQSRALVEAMKAAGGQPRYTEYPELRHNAWDAAYGTAELYEWLLQQRRGQPSTGAGG